MRLYDIWEVKGTMKGMETAGVPDKTSVQHTSGRTRRVRLRRAGEIGEAGQDVLSKARREDQVRELFEERYIPLCRLAAMLLDDGSSAEEVVQEAFVRLYSSWWRIRKVEAGPAYLRTIVVNLCRSRLRHKRVQFNAERVMVASMHTDSRLAADGGNGSAGRFAPPGGEYAGKDESEGVVDMMQVASAVSALPPRQKAITILRYWDDLPESEIAALLGCSVGTVKSQLSKARGTLAGLLEEEPGKVLGAEST